MDTLSDVLKVISLETAMYGLLDCRAPWGLSLPSIEHLRLFIFVRGGCLIRFAESDELISTAAGEVIITRDFVGCELKDSIESSVFTLGESIDSLPERGKPLTVGGAGVQSSLMIGCFSLNTERQNAFLASLPRVLHLKASNIESQNGLESAIRLLLIALSDSGPGSDLLANKLSEVVFVQSIRAYISQASLCAENSGWLKGLADKQIGHALNLMHESPDIEWTVQKLADKSNMSRTAFATKFTRVMNDSPIGYLTSWRMQKAASLLERDSDQNIEEIGAAVGYLSRAAFSKAFKSYYGSSPAEFRKIKRKWVPGIG